MTQWGLPIVAAQNVNLRPCASIDSPITSRAVPATGIEREPASLRLDRLADHLPRGPGHRDPAAVEAHRAHRDADQAALLPYLRAGDPPGRLHRERLRLPPRLVPKVAREDPEPVARLLRLGAVGVEDAEAEVSCLGGNGAPQDPVRSDAEIAVADDADLGLARPRPLRKVGRVEHNVVVAQGMVLVESHATCSPRESGGRSIRRGPCA